MTRIALLALAALVLPAAALAADAVPPAILAQPPKVPAAGEPVLVECQIVDESEIFEPVVYWRVAGGTDYEQVRLEKDGQVFRAKIPTSPDLKALEYFVEAYDAEGNGPARFGAPNLPLKLDLQPATPAPAKAVNPDQFTLGDEGQRVAWRKPAAWGAMGVGVVLAGLGGWMISGHRSDAARFTADFDRTGFFDGQRRDDIAARGTTGGALVGAGTVLLASGAVMLSVDF